jgi:hypothetical protein
MAIDTSLDRDLPLEQREKPCDACGQPAHFNTYCGAWICDSCGKHHGFARCYCGWSLSGRNGRVELEELGETIDDTY